MQKIVKIVMVGMLGCMVVGMHGSDHNKRLVSLLSQQLADRAAYPCVSHEITSGALDPKYFGNAIHVFTYARPIYAGLLSKSFQVHQRPSATQGQRNLLGDWRPKLETSYQSPLSSPYVTRKGYALLGAVAAVVAYARPGLLTRTFNKIKSLLVG